MISNYLRSLRLLFKSIIFCPEQKFSEKGGRNRLFVFIKYHEKQLQFDQFVKFLTSNMKNYLIIQNSIICFGRQSQLALKMD